MSSQQPTGQPSPAKSVPSRPGGAGGGTPIPAKPGFCLLVHARGQPPPDRLTQSLDQHGAIIVGCSDAHTVLAHACRINRGAWMLPGPVVTAGEGAGRGGQAGQVGQAGTNASDSESSAPRAVVVILVDPPALADFSRLGELAEALRCYAPRSTLWFFESQSAIPLRAVSSDDLARWAAVSKDASNHEATDGSPNAGAAGAGGVGSGSAVAGAMPSLFMPPVRTPLRGAAGDSILIGSGTGTGPRLRLVEPDESVKQTSNVRTSAPLPGSASDAPTPSAFSAAAVGPNIDAGIGGGIGDDINSIDAGADAHLLTSEELAMLLGDPESFGEPTNEGGPTA